MRNPIRLAILFLAFIPTACLQAQTTATISGSVSDSSGALLKGARLRAKAIDTGATRFSSTAANGRYTFSNLPSGAYEIRAEAPGSAAAALLSTMCVVTTALAAMYAGTGAGIA